MNEEDAHLVSAWEWQAAMELMNIAQGLLCNGFYNADELVKRLEELANAIAITYGSRGEVTAIKNEILGQLLNPQEH
jgi:hypothetical protein